LFLNKAGYLTEGTISNLFWVRNRIVYTPSITAPVLNGITRAVLLDAAKENDCRLKEGLYPPKALFEAEEAFLSNTAFEVLPLTVVDEIAIGSGKPGTVTQTFHRMYRDAVRDSSMG